MSTPLIRVTSAALLTPEQGRADLELPLGLTLEEMVKRAIPGLPPNEQRHVRVTLVTQDGTAAIDAKYWQTIRPKAGVRVVIRLIPGKDTLRAVLLVVVAVAATAFAPGVATLLGFGGGKVGVALVGAGLNVAGNLLVNALIPAQQPENSRNANTYSISGWSNRARPDAPVPVVFGRHRYAPPFAATSFTEIVGSNQYVRALLCFGTGALKIEDMRLGETSLDEFDDVEIEVREGRAGDAPVSLYPHQVLEDAVGAELVRPLPRDDAGDIIDGDSIETPVVRHTASDTQTVSAIFGFPSGLFKVSDKGGIGSRTVSVRIRQRPEGGDTWSDVVTLDLVSESRISFFRQYSWGLPSRGKYEIEVTRMTDESKSAQVSDAITLAALQSIRPEYPLNIDKPMALVAMRIKATHQLNGALDDFNAIVQRYADAWDGNNWGEALSRNPAAAYVAALQGASNPFPVPDGEIDWDQLADWHDWCALKGLKYDRVHDQQESLDDMLRAICGAGRASPRHDGLKWGVVIDRPESLVIDHINPRNSSDFGWSRPYFEPPHAFRIKFRDETNDYAWAERIVPWPGYTGDITLTEALELPGKTDPDEVWIEARRRQYELMHRADTFTAVQSGMARVVTRGDLVMGSFDVLSRSQRAARVKSISGPLVELDDVASMDADKTYGLRFRQHSDPEDVIGISVVRQVATDPNASSLLRLTGGDALPAVGEVVHFGELASESLALKIRGIEGGEAFSSILNMVAAAPQIDTLTDAETPPAWTGRVGAAITLGSVTPPAPRFARVTSTATWSGGNDPGDEPVPGPGTISVLLTPGANSAVLLSSYRIEHKLSSAGTWSTFTIPVVYGGGDITGYTAEDEVNLRVIAIATDDTESAATATLTLIIGQNDVALPASLDGDAITVQGGLGHAEITLGATSDLNTTQVQLYRVPDGDTLDPATHSVGDAFAVMRGTTTRHIDGDATRINLLGNPGFDTGTGWSLDTNWAVAGGAAVHTAGAADDIQQTVTLTSGKSYRTCSVVSGRTAGDVTPTLFGGTDQNGTAISTDGEHLGAITAVSGNTAFGFAASSDFDGALSEAVLIEDTTATAPAGLFEYWLEPLNENGNPGAMAGPYAARIV
jgi:hypothetical protein